MLKTISQPNAQGQSGETKPNEHSCALPAAQCETYKTKPNEHSCAPANSLSPRQLAAVRILARGHGTMRAARSVGVDAHTICRWKRNPAFRAEVQRLVAALMESALRLRPGSSRHAYFAHLASQRGSRNEMEVA